MLPNGQEPGINSGGPNLDQPSYQGVSAAGDTIGIRFHKLCHPRQPHTNLFFRFKPPNETYQPVGTRPITRCAYQPRLDLGFQLKRVPPFDRTSMDLAVEVGKFASSVGDE